MDDFSATFAELQAELEKGNEEVIEQYKTLINERIKHDDPEGYIALGYAHYLGYSGFGEDYHKALKAFLEALKLTDDPYVANSIGYIYYYGRTSNGVPDYQAAFYYFSLGAKEGVTESVYKIADMYYSGYGVTQNKNHAMRVYEKLYYYMLSYFVDGEQTKFADLCLRQANVSLNEYDDQLSALSYYLEAEYSLRQRMDINYVGDSKLYTKTKQKIAALNEALRINRQPIYVKWAALNFNRHVKGFNETSYTLECRLEPNGPNKAKLTIADAYGRTFLVTIPELNYTKLHDRLTLRFSADVIEEKEFSFTNLEITNNTIIIGDYITPTSEITYQELEILL